MPRFQVAGPIGLLLLALGALPFPVFADAASSTVVYEFPNAVWGAPNGAFVGGTLLYSEISSTTPGGIWIDVAKDFDRWYDASNSYTFDTMEVYLTVAGILNISTHPLSSGTVTVKIYTADESWTKGELVATSVPLPASELFEGQNGDFCNGDGSAASPYSAPCIAKFSFPSGTALSAGQHYVFEINGNGIVGETDLRGETYYYLGLSMVGASVSQYPFGNDGIQDAPNVNTGAVYLRLSVAASEPTPSSASSVLFFPGIEGSRLYDDSQKLWEPSGNSSVTALNLSSDGHGSPNIHTKEGDVIASAGVVGVYQEFIDSMNELVSDNTLTTFEAIPYDWRLPIPQLLTTGKNIDGNIYYDGPQAATSTPYIIQEFHALAGKGKVTIVAHSNGGLLAKALIQRLQETNDPLLSRIEKVILVASPQAGTPEGIAGLLHGHDTGIPFHSLPFIVDMPHMRSLGVNAPGAYALLPSAQYFTYVDNAAVTIDPNKLPVWANTYGQTMHSQELLHNFLIGGLDRVAANSYDTHSPTRLNLDMLTQAEELHASLDSWTPPSQIRFVQIAGWGIPTTLSGIHYVTGNKPFCADTDASTCATFEFGPKYEPAFTVDGDGTVVTPSALWIGGGAERYWMDLAKYNADHPVSSGVGIAQFNHGRILDTDSISSFVSDIISNEEEALSSYGNYIFSTVPVSSKLHLRYSLRSPLTLNLYDDQGRHTGISTTTGEIEMQIPGTDFVMYGDEKFAFSDKSLPIRVILEGYASSTFTFEVTELKNDTVVTNSAFVDLPVSQNTRVDVGITANTGAVSTMAIDRNGDGQTDSFVAPSGGILSLSEMITNLSTTISTLSIKEKQRAQLLNKVANIKNKIAKQQQKQVVMLSKLKEQIQKKAGKNKIDSATAEEIGALLDELIIQSATIPLDTTLIQQLKNQIAGANLTASLKTSLLAKVARLENVTTVTRSLDAMIRSITQKTSRGVLTEADAQNLLNLLDQIQNAL